MPWDTASSAGNMCASVKSRWSPWRFMPAELAASPEVSENGPTNGFTSSEPCSEIHLPALRYVPPSRMMSTCCDAFAAFHAVSNEIATDGEHGCDVRGARDLAPARQQRTREQAQPGEHDAAGDEHEPEAVPTEEREQEADGAQRGHRGRERERQDPNPPRVVVVVQRSVPIDRVARGAPRNRARR